MAQRILIDPITRIEGHLRIEVMVDENNVYKKHIAAQLYGVESSKS